MFLKTPFHNTHTLQSHKILLKYRVLFHFLLSLSYSFLKNIYPVVFLFPQIEFCWSYPCSVLLSLKFPVNCSLDLEDCLDWILFFGKNTYFFEFTLLWALEKGRSLHFQDKVAFISNLPHYVFLSSDAMHVPSQTENSELKPHATNASPYISAALLYNVHVTWHIDIHNC